MMIDREFDGDLEELQGRAGGIDYWQPVEPDLSTAVSSLRSLTNREPFYRNAENHQLCKVRVTDYRRSDERIACAVRARLERCVQVDTSSLRVEVNWGEVVLTGYVNHRLEKRAAAEEARKVYGVIQVRNRLKTYSSPARPAAQATEEAS